MHKNTTDILSRIRQDSRYFLEIDLALGCKENWNSKAIRC